MTADEPIATEAAFHDRLTAVVTEADENGVDVEGAWPVLTEEDDVPDWDLEIVALAGTEQ